MILATSSLLAHAPHLVLLIAVAAIFGWLLMRTQPGPRVPSKEVERGPAYEGRAPTRPVRVGVARRGLLVLGPLLAAVATGAVVYGIELSGSSPSAAVIWIHAGVCVLVLMLAVYKLREVGWAAIRQASRPRELAGAGASLAFSVLLIPLAITGIVLLLAPSSSSGWAYAHLIASAWWTALLLWHLRWHLAAALSVVKSGARATVRILPPELAKRREYAGMSRIDPDRAD